VIAQWVGQYAKRLEHYCQQAPQQWFNFYPFWKADDHSQA
jgi:predicted LPLAT superfamily acyltransferase